jgi:hypothetical protein
MNKKILIVIVLTMVVMTLPIISIAQASQGGVPAENYDDVKIWGYLLPVEDATDVSVRGNVQYGRYAAQSFGAPSSGGPQWIGILWSGNSLSDAQYLMGTASQNAEYKINLNTMHGVVHFKTVITVPGGTFEGETFWNGEFAFRSDYENTLNFVSGVWRNSYRGTGAYEGWKIEISMNSGPLANGAQEAMITSCHLIKPQTIT